MSSGKIHSTVTPYSHRCPIWAAVMSLWHFPEEVLKAHTGVLLTTFFTYVFICCDIDLEWVLWEMVAVTWRLQGNERFYLSNLLVKVSCPSSISKSILRRTLNTEKEHISDLGSILVCPLVTSLNFSKPHWVSCQRAGRRHSCCSCLHCSHKSEMWLSLWWYVG